MSLPTKEPRLADAIRGTLTEAFNKFGLIACHRIDAGMGPMIVPCEEKFAQFTLAYSEAVARQILLAIKSTGRTGTPK